VVRELAIIVVVALGAELGRKPATVSLSNAYVEVYAGSYDVADAFVGKFDNVLVLGDCPL